MVVLLVALLGAMGLWRYHSVVRFNNALRESEQRVRQSEERLRTFIDHVPALVSLKDLDGRYLLMNSQYTKEFGVDATDGKGKDAGALFPAELVKSLEDQEKKVLQARSQVAREQILPHLDGPHVHLCTKFPVMGLSGSIDAIGTISTNITEHKLAEEALAASEARFRDFAEASSDWYWEMDEDLRFSYFSDHFTEVTGVDAAELLGKSREESGIPNVDSEAWQSHLEALENRKPFRNFIHPRPGPDGATVWLSVSGIPYYDKNGAFKGFRGTGNNVTELVAAQRSADQARAEAEAANRAKSNFLASMSHELRTPLNAILGFSEILKEQILGPHVNGKYHEYSADIHSSASYLLELINDLLDISTIEAGKRSLDKEPLAVKDLIDDCMRIFIERAHSKDIELATDVPENNPMLYADKNAIRQILINLLTNAVKFTPNSGSISVLVNSTNKCTEFVVCDNGIRISSGRLSTITDPFIRGELSPDKTDAGWGLGLSIVRSLVELHKGEIDIESQVGKGTSVTIRIPNERCAEMAAA
jgi:PAS domain S-box-containing protein